ncbi:MAG TPA: hypothetical protein VHY84_02980 [Bryobacteraceae bacterium]|jgi:hypothetical protein|nr:hypothetical protein [Bryobacteraceae bacterium]
MRVKTQISSGSVEQERHQAELDLVVPFTTPDLTRSALNAADRMGGELNASLRLVKVQVVPYPLQIDQPPVYLEFLKNQLAQFRSELPMTNEVRLSRESEAGLLGALKRDSIVVLATRRRPWRTRNERLAAKLRRAGHKVVLIYEKANKNA